MKNKNTVVVYESFYEAIQLLSSDEAKIKLFNGMMEYGLNGIEPNFETAELKLSWTFYKPNMDANILRYNKAVESGRKSSGNRLPKNKVEIEEKPEPQIEEPILETTITETKIELKDNEFQLDNGRIVNWNKNLERIEDFIKSLDNKPHTLKKLKKLSNQYTFNDMVETELENYIITN